MRRSTGAEGRAVICPIKTRELIGRRLDSSVADLAVLGGETWDSL